MAKFTLAYGSVVLLVLSNLYFDAKHVFLPGFTTTLFDTPSSYNTDHPVKVNVNNTIPTLPPNHTDASPPATIIPTTTNTATTQDDPPQTTTTVQGISILQRSPMVNLSPDFLIHQKWIPYNPSILRLPAELWATYCPRIAVQEHCNGNNNNNSQAVAVTLFTKQPGDKYGTKVYMGVTTVPDLQQALGDHHHGDAKIAQWLVPPTFVQSVLGPKAADPRLFIVQQRYLAFVAYSAIHETSTVPGMRDYHVRMGVVGARRSTTRHSCDQQTPPPCPPAPPNNNNGTTTGEFFVDCDYAVAHCRDRHKLFGVEVHRHALRHVPQKNLQPILGLDAFSRVVHMVDFAPPDECTPIVYTMDPADGTLIARNSLQPAADASDSCWQMARVAPTMTSWRGSTQIIPLPGKPGLWITILHQRTQFQYVHSWIVLRIQPSETATSAPRVECVYLDDRQDVFEKLQHPKSFNFAVGLAQGSRPDSFWVSFGQNNEKSLLQEITLSIPTRQVNNNALSSSSPDWTQALIPRHPPVVQFHTMFVAPKGTIISAARMDQFVKCFQSMEYHHPGAAIHFFTTKESTFIEQLQARVPFLKIVVFTVDELFQGTPAQGFVPTCDWKNLSDLIRLAILWRWGGSWVDTDDVMIRPVTSLPNVLPFLEWPGLKQKTYWSSHFNLISGKWKHGAPRNLADKFHIQNDPLLNFEPGNPFLLRWIQELTKKESPKCHDWGQKVPSEIVRRDPVWATRHVSLFPQHSLLLHPAFGNHTKKGPMFPYYDYKLPGDFPQYDTLVNETEAETYFKQMVQVQPFVCVKVKDEHYENKQATKRSIPAWIAHWELDHVKSMINAVGA